MRQNIHKSFHSNMGTAFLARLFGNMSVLELDLSQAAFSSTSCNIVLRLKGGHGVENKLQIRVYSELQDTYIALNKITTHMHT